MSFKSAHAFVYIPTVNISRRVCVKILEQAKYSNLIP